MRKFKILAACLIIAVVATGFTYAVWSQPLNIDGFVNTGNLSFEWDQNNCMAATFDRDLSDGNLVWLGQPNVKKINANTLEVTMNNIYPGAGIKLDVLGRNNGTIPAKFKNAVLTFSGDTEVVPYLRSHGSFAWSTTGGLDASMRVVQQPDPVSGQWPLFSRFDDDMTTYLTNNQNNPSPVDVIIKPGGWFSLDKEPNQESPNCIYIKLDENAPTSLSGKSVKFTLTANFEQAQ